MPSLTITNMSEATHGRLLVRATRNGVSVESEAERIIADATRGELPNTDVAAAVEHIRKALRDANGGVMPSGLVEELIADRRAEALKGLEDDRYVAPSKPDAAQ